MARGLISPASAPAGHGPPQAPEFAAKSTSAVLTVPAVRPGALWYCQYRFVWAMTLSGGGAPYGERSSVVWASATRVASYPRTIAPWRVERMHSSVCAPVTISRPTLRAASTGSRSVSSNESPYAFCTSGSESRRASSGTYCQLSLPEGSSSLLCWTQTTSTSAARALSTRVLMLATTLSRSYASPTTPFCTSMTSNAVFGRLSSVVMVPPRTCGSWSGPMLGTPHDSARGLDGYSPARSCGQPPGGGEQLSPSVVAGLDQPQAVLDGRQPGIPVLGDQLEPGPPARARRGPPPLIGRPWPGPGGDRQPRAAVRRQPGRGRGDHRAAADGHRIPRVVGHPGGQRDRVDRGRSRSGDPPRPRTARRKEGRPGIAERHQRHLLGRITPPGQHGPQH